MQILVSAEVDVNYSELYSCHRNMSFNNSVKTTSVCHLMCACERVPVCVQALIYCRYCIIAQFVLVIVETIEGSICVGLPPL